MSVAQAQQGQKQTWNRQLIEGEMRNGKLLLLQLGLSRLLSGHLSACALHTVDLCHWQTLTGMLREIIGKIAITT
jgi:hypothetical protein